MLAHALVNHYLFHFKVNWLTFHMGHKVSFQNQKNDMQLRKQINISHYKFSDFIMFHFKFWAIGAFAEVFI